MFNDTNDVPNLFDDSVSLIIDSYIYMNNDRASFIKNTSVNFELYNVQEYVNYSLRLLAYGNLIGVADILMENTLHIFADKSRNRYDFWEFRLQLVFIKKVILLLHNGEFSEFRDICKHFVTQNNEMLLSINRIKVFETMLNDALNQQNNQKSPTSKRSESGRMNGQS